MKSKFYYGIAVLSVLAFICGCGSSTSDTSTGTVALTASAVSGSGSIVAKEVTEWATPTVYPVMVDKVDITTDATCPSGDSGWVTIYENTPTTACETAITLTEAQASSDYKDIATNPSYGSASNVAAGTYTCMRVTMCDEILAVGTTASCTASYYVLDVYNAYNGGTTDIAESVVFYWSTNGTSGAEVNGSQSDPFLLGSFEVTSGGTITLDMQFDITNSLVYDTDNSPACYLTAPVITFVEQ